MNAGNDSESQVAARLRALHERIRGACHRAGRDPGGVTVVAASKLQPDARIREALAAGQLHFGENYAQHLRDRVRRLGVGPAAGGTTAGPPLPTWHFIGHLQRNKVRYVVGTATLIHTVDRMRLARAIANRARPRSARVLVQVNVAGDRSKQGVDPERALELCEALAPLEGLELAGLMTVPPFEEDPENLRPCFRHLAELARDGRARGLPLHLLSMGMSHDFEVALEEGATHIRPGTALFGPRPRE